MIHTFRAQNYGCLVDVAYANGDDEAPLLEGTEP
jgi:hypothetical protein